jgi:hypothetical protein
MGVPKESHFLAKVDRLTLENDLMRRAGIFRECRYGIHLKRDHIEEDNNTHLHYLKAIIDLQGLTTQKVEVDAKIKLRATTPT